MRFLIASLIAAMPAIAWAQGGIQYDKIEIKTDKLAPNLYMLSGSEKRDMIYSQLKGAQ